MRIFTCICTFFLSVNLATAQSDTLSTCDPDSSFLAGDALVSPLPQINDTLGEGLDGPACIGEPFEQVFFVRLPRTISFGILTLTVTSVRIDSVTNMPEGFTYVCSRPDCEFPADSVSCILLTGMATPENQPGDYELKIGLTINSNLGPIPALIPDSSILQGSYVLTLNEMGDTACLVAPVFDVDRLPVSFRSYPNPAKEEVYLEWQSDHRGTGLLEIRDLTGQLKNRQEVNYQQGLQRRSVNTEHLPSGLYLIGVTGNQTQFWTKVFIH